jgi:hypothetical protein
MCFPEDLTRYPIDRNNMIQKRNELIEEVSQQINDFKKEVNNTIKILIDSTVWVSYFGDRRSELQPRIKLAREVIKYCRNEKIGIYYCDYIENELNEDPRSNRQNNIIQMKEIANRIPSNIGNDTWDQIDVNWENIGSLWNNDKEVELANNLEQKLPDRKSKSNRVDRNIIVTAIQQGINVILHENPNDFNRFQDDFDQVIFIDLLNIGSLEKFIQRLP